MGVELLLDTPIEAVDEDGVLAKGRRIEAANVIWCAGVEASPVARWLDAPTAQGGRVRVGPDLSVPGHPEVFVIGDAAFVTGPGGTPLPGLAPVRPDRSSCGMGMPQEAKRAIGWPPSSWLRNRASRPDPPSIIPLN
jgi:NADPH-dependent 2,4-dienoyl-CoA reductase/sulfur reductase-like enzyme